jgi:tetratricopeptide (TPR) repeat protein
LIPLVALAVVATLVLLRGERPADQRVQLPFDFRQSAGTSTDTLIGSLQERLRENPNDFDSHIGLADAYLQKVRETGNPTLYTKTEDLLDKASKPQGDSPELFAARGSLALARHDFEAALGHGSRALALDPENARYHGIDLRSSLEKARAAYDARPSIHAADTLSWTLYKVGNYQEAQRYASEVLQLNTRDPLKLFHAGMIAKALGEKEQAREYLQQAIDLNPHFSLLYADEAADS